MLIKSLVLNGDNSVLHFLRNVVDTHPHAVFAGYNLLVNLVFSVCTGRIHCCIDFKRNIFYGVDHTEVDARCKPNYKNTNQHNRNGGKRDKCRF